MDATTSPVSVTDALRAADRPFVAVVTSLSPADWARPSPCDGWTARDVLDHVVATQRSFLTDRGVALGSPPALDVDPAVGWAQHRDEVLGALSDAAVADRRFDGFFGPTTVAETFVRFYVFDLVAHRWDIARAAGRDERFSEAELDQLEAGIEGFGPAAYMEGICKPGVTASPGADRQSVVLARLGREG